MSLSALQVPADDSPKEMAIDPELELINVQIVHRHGERTPIKSFLPSFVPPSTWNSLCQIYTQFTVAAKGSSNRSTQASGSYRRRMDDFEDEAPNSGQSQYFEGKCYTGQLTDKGRSTLFGVGSRLRQVYVDQLKFLPTTLNASFAEKSVHLRSTDYPRTIESLTNLLDGLFPAAVRSFSRPLIINTKYVHDETLIGDGQCKKWNLLVKQFKNGYRKHSSDHIDQLKQKYKRFLDDPLQPSLHALYDTFIAVHAHGLPLPEPVTLADIRELEKHAQMLWFEVYRHDAEATRLCIGRFLGEVHANLVSVARGSSANKLAIYSGHDSTLAPLLGAFGIGDGIWPPFAANLAIELYRSPNERASEHYVKMKYNFEHVTMPHCELPGNGHPTLKGYCTLDAFLKHVETFVPKDFAKECQVEA